MTRSYFVQCSGMGGTCAFVRPGQTEQIGINVFHVQTNALAVARSANRVYGVKRRMVVVREGHFKVVDA